MYSKYDNEEFEGYEKSNPSFKDTLIYREVKRVKIWYNFMHGDLYWANLMCLQQVPAHLQNSWESYYMEILMVTGLLAYIMNYIIGKNKNSRLAQAWFNSHRELLESNFALVGKQTSLRGLVSFLKSYVFWFSDVFIFRGRWHQ